MRQRKRVGKKDRASERGTHIHTRREKAREIEREREGERKACTRRHRE